MYVEHCGVTTALGVLTRSRIPPNFPIFSAPGNVGKLTLWPSASCCLSFCFLLAAPSLSFCRMVLSRTFHWHITTRTVVLRDQPPRHFWLPPRAVTDPRGSRVTVRGPVSVSLDNPSITPGQGRSVWLVLDGRTLLLSSRGPDMNRFGLLAPDWRSTRVSPRI